MHLPNSSSRPQWTGFLYFCVIPVFRFCIESGGKLEIVMLAYNLSHFRLTSIQFCCFAAFSFFNSLFSFDFGVIPVFVLNFAVSNSGGKMTTIRKYNYRQSTATVFRFIGLFVYVVYCILRYSDVIPVIHVFVCSRIFVTIIF